MNEHERAQFLAELVAEREALLVVMSGVDEQALTWRTRNPEWTVRDVIAHVLASDTDLISLLRRRPTRAPIPRSIGVSDNTSRRWPTGPTRLPKR